MCRQVFEVLVYVQSITVTFMTYLSLPLVESVTICKGTLWRFNLFHRRYDCFSVLFCMSDHFYFLFISFCCYPVFNNISICVILHSWLKKFIDCCHLCLYCCQSRVKSTVIMCQEQDIRTPFGPMRVVIQGERRLPAIVTYHDIGLNSKFCCVFELGMLVTFPRKLIITWLKVIYSHSSDKPIFMRWLLRSFFDNMGGWHAAVVDLLLELGVLHYYPTDGWATAHNGRL